MIQTKENIIDRFGRTHDYLEFLLPRDATFGVSIACPKKAFNLEISHNL